MRRSSCSPSVLSSLRAASHPGVRGRDPTLEWRGIVEGAYGRPWTHAERMDVLRWMADHGFNAYVHAPKDDLYQRTQWRDPYPAASRPSSSARSGSRAGSGSSGSPT